MGEAEDVVFGRKRANNTAREQQLQREAVELRSKIIATMPRSIANLRKHNYVFASQAPHELTFKGEKRIGWTAHSGRYGDDPCGCDIYILGDGSIVSVDGPLAQEADLSVLPFLCVKDVWGTVWAMANHKKR